MQKTIPRVNYKWSSEITVEQILDNTESFKIESFVEVDHKYPQHLHGLHNGLQVAPEKWTIKSSKLSPFAQSFGIKPNETPQLIVTLLYKKTYECHCKNLKFYFKQRMMF